MKKNPKSKIQNPKIKGNNSRGKYCAVCGKSAVSSYNRPHSLHKTKRVVRPNLQKSQNQLICTGCLKKYLHKK